MVQIDIGNLYSRIDGALPEAVEKELFADLSYKIKDAEYIIDAINERRRKEADRLKVPYKPTEWDGIERLIFERLDETNKKRYLIYYTGMKTSVSLVLEKHKIAVRWKDRRLRPEQNLPDLTFTFPPGKSEREYQKLMVNEGVKATRGIFEAATGSGKTMVITQLIAAIKTAPFVFYVMSKDLMYQAHKTLTDCLKQPIGLVGDTLCDIQPITVAMAQVCVLALHRNEKNFDYSTYRLEDETAWDEERKLANEKGAAIEKMVMEAKGLYVDECVSGDTIISTDKGEIPIADVLNSGASIVLTHDGKNTIWKPIKRLWKKGKRKTLRIQLEGGNLVCTPEHQILTKDGWREAKEIKRGDQLLCVNADVENESPQGNTAPIGTSSVTKCDNENTALISGKEFCKDPLKRPQNASAAACNTKWKTVTNITESEPREVYDIEVEGTHCFFANNILVHNCHHAACNTIKEVMLASKKAYWRFGGSATPFREDGAEKMLQALFGKCLVRVTASWLIKHGYLVQPYILDVIWPDGADGIWSSYQKIYKECIVNNPRLHDFTVKVLTHLRKRGLPALALVKEYPHGDELVKRLPDIPFLRGDKSAKKRNEIISDLRDGIVPYAIGTTIADEGLDIERLVSILVVSGGKSKSKVHQRVGRVLRLHESKTFGIAIFIHHDGRYLDGHGDVVRRLLKREKGYVFREVTPENILEEIDNILREQKRETLLD